jgi:hypothetical protein
MNLPTNWIDVLLKRAAKTIPVRSPASPSRFDVFFPQQVQGEAARGAEQKRARKARLRRLNRA